MPTNEQRRETAKRKLERQLERRAAQARKRRLKTIIGATVAAIVVIGAVVATVVITNRDSRPDRLGRPDHGDDLGRRARPRPATTRRCRRSPHPPIWAPTASTRPAEPASKQVNPPRTGKVPTDPAQVSASMATNQGNIGLQLDNAQVAVHGQQLRQPGPAGLLQRHAVPPVDHHPAGGAAVRRPDRRGHRRPGLRVRQRIPDQPVPARRSGAAAAGGLPARHAGDGQRRSRHQRQPVLPGVRDSQLPPNYTVFGTIDETGLATLDKIAEAGVAGGGQDGKPTSSHDQVDPAGLTPGERPPRRHTARIRHRRRAASVRTITATRGRGRPTRWPSRRWSARSCSRRWASCSATSRCRRSSAPARTAAGWPSPGWSSVTWRRRWRSWWWPCAVFFVLLARNVDSSLDDLSPDYPGCHRVPVGARTPAAAVRPAAEPRRQLPVPAHHRAGEQARQAARGPAGCPPIRPWSAPASPPAAATSGCNSTTARRRAPSTASPAWPSRATSTARRATG